MSAREQSVTKPQRLEGAGRDRPLHILFNGSRVQAFEGQTIGAALWGAGHRQLRRTSRRNEPRGLFCGMGVCFDCLVRVDGRDNVQACLTPVRDGMVVQTQQGDAGLDPDS